MAVNNALNLNVTGVVTSDGDGTFTGNTVTEGAVLLAGSGNTITDTGVLTKGILLVGDGTTAPTQLAVGTNTHALTADSTEASGVKYAAKPTVGSDAWSLVSSQTISSSESTVEVTGMSVAGATYKIILIDVVNSDATVNLNLRTSIDAITYDTTGYQGYSTTYIAVTGAAVDGTHSVYSEITIVDPQATADTWVFCSVGWVNTSATSADVFGVRLSNGSVEAVQFYFSGGTIESGTFLLYKLSAT